MRPALLHVRLAILAWMSLVCPTFALQIEGPLDNDAYLPLCAGAEQELARGDQAYALALRMAAQPELSQPAWIAMCEAWRTALQRGAAGESVSPRPELAPGDKSPWNASERANERFSEGLEEAVFWRLAQLPAAGRSAWNARFATLALDELARAGDSPGELERVERALPATAGAARAALLLAEIAYEAGDPHAARRWLERARRHASHEAPESAAILKGLERRSAALPRIAPPSSEAWRDATSLEFFARRELEATRNPGQRTRALGSGPQAGMAFLSGGQALLQTPSGLWGLDLTGGKISGPFENTSLLAGMGLAVEPCVAPGDGPGWRLDPAAEGSSAVFVAGRSLVGGAGFQSNVLACVDCAPFPAEPRLRWALPAHASLGGSGASDSTDDFEFQPGPLCFDGLVFVLRRRSGAASGEREIELVALDAAHGSLRWRTLLGKGGERTRDLGRFARRGVATLPAEPLLATAGGIFASAQLGFGALVDPLDGRLRYTLRNRRRPAEERGWTGWGSATADSGQVILWAPGDSDHLYWLASGGPGDPASPLLGVPEPIGEAEALVAGERGGALLLSRAGARRSLTSWTVANGERLDALRLGPEEVFAGRALASETRVFAASDRALYLFDRTKDLGLLATAGLGGSVSRGGNVWAQGQWVFVLSSRTIEIFRTR